MSTDELLRELQQRGVVLATDGERLIYRVPRGVLTDDLRRKIIAYKPKLLALVRQKPPALADDQAEVPKMTLAEFARSGRVVRVRSLLLGEDVWWVSSGGLEDRVPDPTLVVYTACELRRLISVSPQDLINIHRVKKTFCGHIEN